MACRGRHHDDGIIGKAGQAHIASGSQIGLNRSDCQMGFRDAEINQRFCTREEHSRP
jgi:hypothetical protein